ncbi:MAG: hypothetical protein ACE5G0_21225, partial [Rhodothermales bacterium]
MRSTWRCITPSWPPFVRGKPVPDRKKILGLAYVTVISAVEAAQINVGFKRQAERTLRANLAEKGEGYIGQNIDEIAVQVAAQVDELLEAIKQEGYFSSWVIIE